MSTYVIGDIHGCFRTLQSLLHLIRFDPRHDRLWIVGDLVNGGPDSLSVLRWAFQHQEAIQTVLGNHDVYLLGRAFGACRRKSRDTLDAILKAPDCEELIEWLRFRPLLIRDGGNALVHAGLMPDWSFDQAFELADSIQRQLRGKSASPFLRDLFEKKRDFWDPESRPRVQRLLGLQILTTLRTCRNDGQICRRFTGPPEEAPGGCIPWYINRKTRAEDPLFYFGHWAALGFRRLPGAIALDSGCVWGGQLTALRLHDTQVFQVPNSDMTPA